MLKSRVKESLEVDTTIEDFILNPSQSGQLRGSSRANILMNTSDNKIEEVRREGRNQKGKRAKKKILSSISPLDSNNHHDESILDFN